MAELVTPSPACTRPWAQVLAPRMKTQRPSVLLEVGWRSGKRLAVERAAGLKYTCAGMKLGYINSSQPVGSDPLGC